jgi:predicted AAA+ superfamily ATPase
MLVRLIRTGDTWDGGRDRELAGLAGAMSKHGLTEGIILTYNQEETIVQDDSSIRVLPVWRWLIKYEDDQPSGNT